MKKQLLTLVMIGIAAAAAADVTSGSTYRIWSAMSETRTLFVTNSETASNTQVVLWTDTDVPAQQWQALQNDDGTMSFVNIATGRYLGRSTSSVSSSTKLQQSSNLNTQAKWTLEEAEDGEGYYYMSQTASSTIYYLTAASDEDGAAGSFKSSETTDGSQVWKFEEVEAKTELTEAMRAEMADGWLTQHLRTRSNSYQTLGDGGGWGDAEMLETLLDAYETTGDQTYIDTFASVFNYFKAYVGTNWLQLVYNDNYKWYGHDYNDDVMWMIIASIRAYHLTGTTIYRSYAKNNFDKIYDRALNEWGMLRWAEDSGDDNGTNSCINGPAEVAACYIALALTGSQREEYFEIARDLYDNQRRYLFNAQTGEVFDSFTWDSSTNLPGSYNRWVSTYNQGTMLGAAVMLYNYYGDEKYKEDAEMIMECTKDELCDDDGIINVCQTASGDLCGFKGILMRYVRRYVVDLRKIDEAEWLTDNALRAYNNRNSAGVTSSAWLTKSAEDWYYGDTDYSEQPFGNSTAVSAAFNAPRNADRIIKDAYSKIYAEDFNYHRNLYLVDEEEAEGGRALTNPKNGSYACFSNVNFGTCPAKGIEIRVSDANYDGVGVDIYLDDPTEGTLIGSVEISTEGGWKTISADISPTDGMHNVYLVFTAGSTAKDVVAFDNLVFTTDTTPLPNDITDNGGDLTASVDVDDLENLIDDSLTTAVTTEGTTNTFTYTSTVAAWLRGYAVGNTTEDASEDPASWELQGSNDGDTWVTIDTQSGVSFASRCITKRYKVSVSSKYTQFRLIATNNGGSNLSIGELLLFGTALSSADITADSGSLSAGDETVIDKTSSTISETAAGESTDYTYQGESYYMLTSYSITSTENVDITPSGWTLYGKDGTSWIVIDEVTDATFAPYVGSTQFYPVSPDATYQTYKLTINAPDDSNAEISEIQLFGHRAGTKEFYNDITKNGGSLSSSDGQDWTTLRAFIDNDAETTVEVTFDDEAWVQYSSDIPVQLSAYKVCSGYDDDKSPKAWTLQASADGSSWTSINSQTNQSFRTVGTVKEYTISSSYNTKEYKHFRLVASALSGDASSMVLSEISLHGICIADDDLTDSDATVTAEMPGYSTSESYEMLFDGSADTKYCFDYYGSAWIEYEAPEAITVNLYSITSANDNATRDPKSWELQGSDDGETWYVIDSREDEEFYDRQITQFYSVADNTTAYKYLRLQITENSSALLAQLSEWQMFYSDVVATGIEQAVSADEDINLSFSRSNGNVNIELSGEGTAMVYNASGQAVATQRLGAGNNSIDLSGLAKGIYIIKVNTGGGSRTIKVAK